MNEWQLAQELFELTAGLPPLERERVLSDRLEGNLELARHVEALVLADAQPHLGFSLGATKLLLQLQEEPAPEELCGLTFDAYRIDAFLSSGGMAHVYRATRTSAGTTRRVALKVLRPSLASQSFLERFQRERETLADLEHEHIVSFLDAGELPDGRPFLVMEYIEGVPLCDWKQDAPLRTKIDLFVQVLSAVQYAHERFIVHRDIKPSNVLVTGQGIPKLLDFGVASALDAKAGTSADQTPLTPAFASPEVLAGRVATSRSDVFSLGVLLREFLGRDPSEAGGTPLNADLSAIVNKALAGDPALRYGSPGQMGSDLEHFLAGEPISARRGSWLYHARLTLRRQRIPLLLISSVILALVAGWVGSDMDRRHAKQEASIGWGAHSQAKYASRIFEDLLVEQTSNDPALASSAAASLEQSLRSDLSLLPETQTLVRITLARLYLERGEFELATQEMDRAQELAESTRGVGDMECERIVELRINLQAAQGHRQEGGN